MFKNEDCEVHGNVNKAEYVKYDGEIIYVCPYCLAEEKGGTADHGLDADTLRERE